VTTADSTEWNRRYAEHDLVWGLEPNRFVAEVLADVPPGRALDVAAGEGRNAIWLAGRGWRVTAVDFASVAVERGRTLAGSAGLKLDWVVADVRDYRPPAGSFDAVVLAYLQFPIAELAPVLHRAAEAVAPGGLLLAVGHDLTNLTEGVGGPQRPEVLYTPEAIAAELPGLVVRRAERVRRPVTTPDGEATAIDTLVLAAREPATG
jgi:SAM-dependent methyltransferase